MFALISLVFCFCSGYFYSPLQAAKQPLHLSDTYHINQLMNFQRHRLVKGCGNGQNSQHGSKDNDEVKMEMDSTTASARPMKEET